MNDSDDEPDSPTQKELLARIEEELKMLNKHLHYVSKMLMKFRDVMR